MAYQLVKQVPVHSSKKPATCISKDRLKKADSKLKIPKNRIKDKESQIGRDNVSRLMRSEFDFDPKKY